LTETTHLLADDKYTNNNRRVQHSAGKIDHTCECFPHVLYYLHYFVHYFFALLFCPTFLHYYYFLYYFLCIGG
jgi:hypothetical protein